MPVLAVFVPVMPVKALFIEIPVTELAVDAVDEKLVAPDCTFNDGPAVSVGTDAPLGKP